MLTRLCLYSVIALAMLIAGAAQAQQMDDLRALRLKLSAGDLPSAESILEVHRAAKGEDAEYLMGVAWLARGAALVGDWPAASTYAQLAMERAQPLLSTPAAYAEHWGAVYALGTAIEVQAQALVAAGKKPEALRLLEASAKARAQAPYALRARIQKRWNLIGLVGEPAPPIHADEWIGAPAAWVEQLHGQPTVLFFWAEGCGDCKAQAAAFRRIVDRFAPRGVQFAAPTRFYTEDHAAEKKRAELVWRDVYGAPPQVAVPDSEAAMLLYGVSSTPTLVLVDRQGRVRLYSPTRMSEERLAREIEKLLR